MAIICEQRMVTSDFSSEEDKQVLKVNGLSINMLTRSRKGHFQRMVVEIQVETSSGWKSFGGLKDTGSDKALIKSKIVLGEVNKQI
jgi:hypothetical protein